MIRTKKQLQIMKVIVKGNDDGSFVDMDQLLQRIPYETTKQSMQFSIRKLIQRKLITKHGLESRRGRSHVVFSPTLGGYKLIRERYYPATFDA